MNSPSSTCSDKTSHSFSGRWLRIVEMFLATLFGGLIAAGTLWWELQVRREAELQNWFQEVYIEDGIEVMGAYVNELLFYKFNTAAAVQMYQAGGISLSDPVFRLPDIPGKAIERVRNLLGNDIYSELFFELVNIRHKGFDADLLNAMRDNLVKLKDILLYVKLANARDVYSIKESDSTKRLVDEVISIACAIKLFPYLRSCPARFDRVEHLSILERGSGVWNNWRNTFPAIPIKLARAELAAYDLSGYNFQKADFQEALLHDANLTLLQASRC